VQERYEGRHDSFHEASRHGYIRCVGKISEYRFHLVFPPSLSLCARARPCVGRLNLCSQCYICLSSPSLLPPPLPPFRVYLYFFLFGFIAALLGVWAMLQNDTTSIPAAIAKTDWPTPPDPTKLQSCNDMNKFHALLSILYAPHRMRANPKVVMRIGDSTLNSIIVFGGVCVVTSLSGLQCRCFAQAAVMIGLALMLWKFNGCCCWIFTIVFVIGYTFIMLAETAILVMVRCTLQARRQPPLVAIKLSHQPRSRLVSCALAALLALQAILWTWNGTAAPYCVRFPFHFIFSPLLRPGAFLVCAHQL